MLRRCLLRSRAVMRGLDLDAAALNASTDAALEGPLPARFNPAVVPEVELAASRWGAPALDAVVRGVDVSLTPSLLLADAISNRVYREQMILKRKNWRISHFHDDLTYIVVDLLPEDLDD